MFVLMRSDADGTEVFSKFATKPTHQDLYSLFFDYYDEIESEELATQLLTYGVAESTSDTQTNFELV